MQYFDIDKPHKPVAIVLFYRVNKKAILYTFSNHDFVDTYQFVIKKQTIDRIIDQVNLLFNKQFEHTPFDITIDQLLAYLVPLSNDLDIQGKIGYTLVLDQMSIESFADIHQTNQIHTFKINSHNRHNEVLFF
jgi:hypothetical protein